VDEVGSRSRVRVLEVEDMRWGGIVLHASFPESAIMVCQMLEKDMKGAGHVVHSRSLPVFPLDRRPRRCSSAGNA